MNVKYDYTIEELNSFQHFIDLVNGEESSSIRFQTLMTCCFFAQIEEQIRFFTLNKTASEDGEVFLYSVAMIGIASNQEVALIVASKDNMDVDEVREALVEIQSRESITSPLKLHSLAAASDEKSKDFFNALGFSEEGYFNGNAR